MNELKLTRIDAAVWGTMAVLDCMFFVNALSDGGPWGEYLADFATSAIIALLLFDNASKLKMLHAIWDAYEAARARADNAERRG